MTNEEYAQWQPLIKKVAYKYRNNIFKIELEDLEQIASVGLFKGFENYDDSKGASLKTWLYSVAERAIFREFTDMKRIKRQSSYECISLNIPTGEEGTYLEEIIPDNNINIEHSVTDKLLIASYKEEVDSCLFGREREVVYKILFEDKTNAELAREYNITDQKVKNIQTKGFRNLRHKSRMIRDKWMELKEVELENIIISAYNNPDKVYSRIESTERLRKKYKLELDTLDFIQNIFDGILYSTSPSNKIKEFYMEKLNEIISSRDLYILNEIVFKERSMESLKAEEYSFEDVFYIKDRVKNIIIKNKDLAYDLWVDFNENYKESSKVRIDKKALSSVNRVVNEDNIILNSNQVTLEMVLGL
ncbi:MAG: sigma-70 family RNA polymerase sigma factor [Terrisporobacter sp.]